MAAETSKYDIMEIIFKKENQIQYKIFKKKENAEDTLNKYSADIRLDYHNVLDLTGPYQPLMSNQDRGKHIICVISYVGKNSDRRIEARKDIMRRIETGQIDFGILIFKRCLEPILCNKFHDVGSKAWVNFLLGTRGNAVFIDDSDDHYNSVRSMNIPNLKAILFKERDDEVLLKLINDELLLMTGGYYKKYIKYKTKYLMIKNVEK